MVTAFVDTSALYALLDEDDRHHRRSRSAWQELLTDGSLVTHSYVVVETTALLQRRLGKRAAVQLHDGLLPVVRVISVDEPTHQMAVERWRALRSRVSLVDVTSFVFMRELVIDHAFAYDPDFRAAGFSLVD